LTEEILIYLASIILIGIGAQWIAWRLGLPSILILLILGLIAGPITGFLKPDELLGELLVPFVSLSVAMILFEGGLNLKIGELREIGIPVRNLITIGLLTTWAMSSLAAYFILDLATEMAILIGSILVVTGPTVVLPILIQIQPKGRVGNMAKWEGIMNDPIGAYPCGSDIPRDPHRRVWGWKSFCWDCDLENCSRGGLDRGFWRTPLGTVPEAILDYQTTS